MSMTPLAALLLLSPFSVLAATEMPHESVCTRSQDNGKTECPSLLQTSSAGISKRIVEDDEGVEDSERLDSMVMRSDDEELVMEHRHKGQLAPLTCSQEETIRKTIADKMHVKESRSARIIRVIFHDAVDENNLLVKNAESGKWEPVEGNYGGVDGCLYSPLSEGDKGFPEPSHNKNLGGIHDAYNKMCGWMCKAGYANTSLCSSMSNCVIDLKVLGALVTIEGAGGPRIPMTWGRKKGNCATMIVSKDKAVSTPALRFAPSLTGVDDADSFRSAFDRLGFSPKEQAALMGAHSFGKLAVCAGGLNGVEKGQFCNKAERLDPPLKPSNYAPWSVPHKGPCKPIYGKVGGGVSNGCWARTSGGDLAPVFARQDSKSYGRGLGDGGFFDRTPDTFDNDYYKLFAEDTFDGKDVCCGKMKKGRCERAKGWTQRITKRAPSGRGLAAVPVKGGVCSVSWCRDDRKCGKEGKCKAHMKSTRAWHEAPHDFVKKGAKFGVTKRMVRLAGDWALLGNTETHASVKLFAKDQSAFFEAFKGAFTKVMDKGYKSLTPCSSGKEESGDEKQQQGGEKPGGFEGQRKGKGRR